MCEIWSDWLDKQKCEKQPVKYLPPIWPVIIYHGKQAPYPESTDIRDLFEDRSLVEAMLNEPFQLIDLTQISDEELKKQGLAASFQLLQKHIFERDNWDFVQQLLHLIKPVAELLGDDLLLAMLNYMANYGKIDDKERFRRLVVEELPDYEEKLMSIAQQWREEGKQQGLQQGMQQMRQRDREIIQRMLAEKQKKSFISKITGLTEEEMDALLNEDNGAHSQFVGHSKSHSRARISHIFQ
jgi:predicted transposase/invertase (TIGR01784 family)